MGILARIGRGIWDGLTSIGRAILGLFVKVKPSREEIRAVLRKQWLELAPGEVTIEGVEYEGEVYYATPK